MRAAVLRELGGVPACEQADSPGVGDGHVVVEVSAASINPVDLRIASGRWHGVVPKPPYVPGTEGVGRLADGRRVWFMAQPGNGSFAERCSVDPQWLVELPEQLSDELGCCLGVAGLAAWLSLSWRGHLKSGETVVVLGASGPVGTIAVQAAKLMGAGRVVAAGRSEAGLERALALGADAVVNITTVDDLKRALMDATDGGAQLTIDPVWGEPARAAVDAAAFGGRIVQLGESAAPEATFSSAVVRGRMISILGFSNFHVPVAQQLQSYREMADHAAAGRLKVDYETYPLEGVADAWLRQGAGPGLKIVLSL